MSASAHRRLHDPKYLQLHIPGNGHVQDVSGHGIATTPTAITYATGPYSGHQVMVSGAGSQIVAALPFTDLSVLTMSCMMKLTLTGTDPLMFGFGDFKANGLHLFLENSSSYRIYLMRGGINAYDTGITPTGAFQYFALTKNAGTYSLYIDGAFVYTVELGEPLTPTLGYFLSDSDFPATCQMANARVYNIVLTGDEIFSLYEYDKR